MFLSKPCFEIKIQREDLEGIVKNHLDKKYWRQFSISSISLLFEPYYFFNYDAFFEKKSEETGALIVSDTQSGVMALNAVSGEFDESISSLFEYSEPVILKEKPMFEEVEVEIERVVFSEQEVKRIAPMRLAAKLEVSKQSIELSSIKLAFVPFWEIFVKLGEEEFELVVNAVSGEIAEESEIPYRKQSLMELTAETVKELKSPNAWLDYSVRLYHRIVGSKVMQSFGKAILTNRWVQAAILIIIIFLVLWKPGIK